MDYRTLISPQQLSTVGPVPDQVVIDCRFDLADNDSGYAAYREGHIPGAYYAHLEQDLSAPVSTGSGRHPLPDWRRFAELLGQWGLHPDSQVIVYDQDNGAYAARLWWMLRAVGHRAVAVLDGGWPAWLAAGGLISTELPPGHTLHYTLGSGTGWVTTSEIMDNLRDGQFILVDARSETRFRGEQEPIDPVAGHIPGAVNYPFTCNLRANGCFKSSDQLRAEWQALIGNRDARSVVHMCGSGVTACHNLLAMEQAGLGGSRLYVGSWSEWIRDASRPVAGGCS
jgi:thiosulfate/3-mercaptopyruvate sulfurtransferase